MYMLSVQYFCPILTRLLTDRRSLVIVTSTKFYENPSIGSPVVPCGILSWQMTTMTVTFCSSFASRVKTLPEVQHKGVSSRGGGTVCRPSWQTLVNEISSWWEKVYARFVILTAVLMNNVCRKVHAFRFQFTGKNWTTRKYSYSNIKIRAGSYILLTDTDVRLSAIIPPNVRLSGWILVTRSLWCKVPVWRTWTTAKYL